LLAVIGLGGMGKSALTWDWLHGLIHQKQAPRLVAWWRFYETDGTLDRLMARMLEHFGDKPGHFPSLRAMVDRVIDHLRQSPALLVLDGAERLHVLSRTYDTLPASARDLLGRLAAFRSSIPWETIVAVFGNRREDIKVLERRG
jgi:GTPase SAR1 family protein